MTNIWHERSTLKIFFIDFHSFHAGWRHSNVFFFCLCARWKIESQKIIIIRRRQSSQQVAYFFIHKNQARFQPEKKKVSEYWISSFTDWHELQFSFEKKTKKEFLTLNRNTMDGFLKKSNRSIMFFFRIHTDTYKRYKWLRKETGENIYLQSRSFMKEIFFLHNWILFIFCCCRCCSRRRKNIDFFLWFLEGRFLKFLAQWQSQIKNLLSSPFLR